MFVTSYWWSLREIFGFKYRRYHESRSNDTIWEIIRSRVERFSRSRKFRCIETIDYWNQDQKWKGLDLIGRILISIWILQSKEITTQTSSKRYRSRNIYSNIFHWSWNHWYHRARDHHNNDVGRNLRQIWIISFRTFISNQENVEINDKSVNDSLE